MRRSTTGTSRRSFLKEASATATACAIPLEAVAHAAGSDLFRVGLIGCGGRGTGAAINATNAGKDVRVVALADLFPERLSEARAALMSQRPEQVDLPPERCFIGFDAYEALIGCGVDVVLIACTSHFTPQVLEAAVSAGKHVFCEKPHGIDILGLNRSRAACEQARDRGLSVVSGLCWRYDLGVRETMKRVHDGAIGEIQTIQETYLTRPYVVRERQAGQTEMEYQLWNWYHFNWLSGDQTSQQLIHSLDKASWALGDRTPRSAWGLGGRQTCLEPVHGDQFDHQAVVFDYEGGARVFGFCRNQKDCYNDTSDLLIGTKGRCDLLKNRIEGEVNWHYDGPKPKMVDVEHDELFASIRAGRRIDNSHYMILSTALAIMAQMACYSGQSITWEQAMSSTRSFAPERYGWDVEPPVKPESDGRYPAAQQGTFERQRWLS